jgi:hypothetical protein
MLDKADLLSVSFEQWLYAFYVDNRVWLIIAALLSAYVFVLCVLQKPPKV